MWLHNNIVRVTYNTYITIIMRKSKKIVNKLMWMKYLIVAPYEFTTYLV